MAINSEESTLQPTVGKDRGRGKREQDIILDKIIKANSREKVQLTDAEEAKHEQEMEELMSEMPLGNQPTSGKHTSGHGAAMSQEAQYKGTAASFTKKFK